jgi:hypothetical protein
MNKWEYKIVTINTLHQPDAAEWLTDSEGGNRPLRELFDSMGNEGWELVAFYPARPVNQPWIHPVSKCESTLPADPWLYNAIFKRPPETWEERKERIDRERLQRRIKEHSTP